uniref:Ion_trans_2 domain-containing protein n=1 Tax=Panagrellus redivivus TaxID=6233 RepID=A0A7E4UVW6_PANRE
MAATVAAIANKEPLSPSPCETPSPNTDVTQHTKTPKNPFDDDNDNSLMPPQTSKPSKTMKKIRHHRRKRPCCFLLYFVTLAGYCCLGASIFMCVERGQYKIDVEQRKHFCEELRINITKNISGSIVDVITPPIDDNTTQVIDETERLMGLFNEGLSEIEDCLKSMTTRKPTQLNFTGAAFYSISVVTTVGYGDIIMETPIGRIVTMFYAIVGIPLYIAFISDLGDILGARIVWLGKQLKNGILRLRKRRPLTHEERSKNPHSYYRYGLVGFFLAVLLLLTSVMVQVVENYWGKHWSYLETLHFVFSTVTLVGFGDFVATHEAFIFIYLPFLIVGQTLVALCFYFSQRIIRYDIPHFITGCCLRARRKKPQSKQEEESSDTTSAGPGFHGQGILSVKMHPPSDSSDEGMPELQPVLSLGKFMPCVPGEAEEKSSTMTVFARTPYYPSFSLISPQRNSEAVLPSSDSRN